MAHDGNSHLRMLMHNNAIMTVFDQGSTNDFL